RVGASQAGVVPTCIQILAARLAQIYTLSLHDALPICTGRLAAWVRPTRSRTSSTRLERRPRADAKKVTTWWPLRFSEKATASGRDRKSTRLNSSHVKISYAVFCLKKKTMQTSPIDTAQ